METILLGRSQLEAKGVLSKEDSYIAIVGKSYFLNLLLLFSFLAQELKEGRRGMLLTSKRMLPIEILTENYHLKNEDLSNLLIAPLNSFEQEINFIKKIEKIIKNNREEFLCFEDSLNNYYHKISGMVTEDEFKHTTRLMLWKYAFLKSFAHRNEVTIYDTFVFHEDTTYKTEKTVLNEILTTWPDVILRVEGEDILELARGKKEIRRFKLIFKKGEVAIKVG